VLIGTAAVLLTLRLGALASAASPEEAVEAAVSEAPAQEDEAQPTAGNQAQGGAEAEEDHAAAVPDPAPAEKSSPTTPAVAQAQTKGEAEVLQNLSARRVALEERERDLAMREQLVSVTEKRLEERLGELKALEERLNAMLAKRDEAEEAQLTALVKTYENMKPADAARIFNKLDRQVLLTVASRMKPAKIGAVMAAMEPAKAQELTVMLALRLNVARPRPEPQQASGQPQG
jgi:flagellar motility protein MotE (MotC chaperone)